MSDLDFYLTYIGMPLGILVLLALYAFRRKGRFTSMFGRVIYFALGLISASICGLVMHIHQESSFVFSVTALVIYFFVFIYNAPIRRSGFKN